MGLFTVLAGLVGCKSRPDDFEDEGTDFSESGPGEYSKVLGCEFGINGYTPGFNYLIKSSEDGKVLLTYESMEHGHSELTCEISDETMTELSKLCEKLNVRSWDKFRKSAKHVLDGSGFSLTMDFEDGKHISAQGSNSFPKNYSEFESGFIEIFKPVIEAARADVREEKYKNGDYSGKLELAMVNYAGRGASGSDSYSFLIRESNSGSTGADMKVKSISGKFIEPGDYRFYGNPEDSDELLGKIQEILENYQVYKWDGYDKSTSDYNDREWFQLNFCYENATINCCGCGDTENYAQVREEMLEVILDYMQKWIAEENQ